MHMYHDAVGEFTVSIVPKCLKILKHLCSKTDGYARAPRFVSFRRDKIRVKCLQWRGWRSGEPYSIFIHSLLLVNSTHADNNQHPAVLSRSAYSGRVFFFHPRWLYFIPQGRRIIPLPVKPHSLLMHEDDHNAQMNKIYQSMGQINRCWYLNLFKRIAARALVRSCSPLSEFYWNFFFFFGLIVKHLQ